jgi:hypothetical protein
MNEFQAIRKKLEEEKDAASIADIWAFSIALHALSVKCYLGMRQGSYTAENINYRLPLSTVAIGQQPHPPIAKDQWTTEVETWFRRAILEAILEAQIGLRERDLMILFGSNSQYQSPESSTCDRILFRNANHTNINWVGL